MARFFIGGQPIDLPAVQLVRGSTRDTRAWMHGQYSTVRLLSSVEGVRVHTNGRSFPGREASHAIGAWIAIGDVIQSSQEFEDSRALPGSFTHLGWALIPEQAVINVGLSGPLFGACGGGFQAEHISGPLVRFNQARGKVWHAKQGSA